MEVAYIVSRATGVARAPGAAGFPGSAGDGRSSHPLNVRFRGLDRVKLNDVQQFSIATKSTKSHEKLGNASRREVRPLWNLPSIVFVNFRVLCGDLFSVANVQRPREPH